MRKERQYLAALHVIKESRNLLWRERTREPLHVVFHENLHGAAIDGATALDRRVQTATDRHMGAEKNFGIRIADCGLCLLFKAWLVHSALRNRQSAIAKISSDASPVSSDFLHRYIRKACRPA